MDLILVQLTWQQIRRQAEQHTMVNGSNWNCQTPKDWHHIDSQGKTVEMMTDLRKSGMYTVGTRRRDGSSFIMNFEQITSESMFLETPILEEQISLLMLINRRMVTTLLRLSLHNLLVFIKCCISSQTEAYVPRDTE